MKTVANGEKRSPLYTSRAHRAAKTTVIKEKGRDSDGAYRAANRRDTKAEAKA